jgi:hypothetical protein
MVPARHNVTMDRRVVLTGVAILVALSVAPASSTATARPALRLVDAAPLAVQGVRFDPAATVRLRVFTFRKTWTKRVDVGARGSFVARFPAIEARRCGMWVAVQAIASDGAKAGLHLPHFECPTRR